MTPRSSRLAGASLAALVLGASQACAGTIAAKDMRFEADVSNSQMSRISIDGEKIVDIKKIDDASGPKILIEAEDTTGDIFVGFDDDAIGKSYTLFLITATGKTVQGILRPVSGEGQNVIVRLAASEGASNATTGNPSPQARVEKRSSYPETMSAFIKMMWNRDELEAVKRRKGNGAISRGGPFEVSLDETYEVAGLLGEVLNIKNTANVAVVVDIESYLRPGVLAAAASHEQLGPGEIGRIFLVEEAR